MKSLSSKPWASLNWPNRISILRLLLVAPFVTLILNQRDPEWHSWARYVALGIFVIMALSDFVDGMLARRLNLKTRLGAILDPLADKVLIICSVVLLSLPGSSPDHFTLPNWVVVAVVGKDLWVILGVIVIYLATDRLRIRPTVAGKVSTLLQLSMVILVLLGPDLEWLCKGLGVWVVRIMTYLVAAMSLLAIISYTRLGLIFVSQEGKLLDDAGGKDTKSQ